MATQLDRLTKIGHEGFALIAECYGQSGRSGTRRPLHHHQSQQQQQSLVYYGPQVSTVRLPVAASNEIAQHFGGIMATDAAITSDQAAEYYGGFVIVDHGRRQPSRRPAY